MLPEAQHVHLHPHGLQLVVDVVEDGMAHSDAYVQHRDDKPILLRI